MQQKIFKNAENHDFGRKRQKNPRKTAGLGMVLAKSGGEERKLLQRKRGCAQAGGGRRIFENGRKEETGRAKRRAFQWREGGGQTWEKSAPARRKSVACERGRYACLMGAAAGAVRSERERKAGRARRRAFERGRGAKLVTGRGKRALSAGRAARLSTEKFTKNRRTAASCGAAQSPGGSVQSTEHPERRKSSRRKAKRPPAAGSPGTDRAARLRPHSTDQ